MAGGSDNAIAVIGLSGRFPGGADAEQLWANLATGVCTVTDIPEDRRDYWDLTGLAAVHAPLCRRGAFLSDVDRFDAGFFGIPPREAMFMDPQQRLLLEEACKAIEDAGYAPQTLQQLSCAVYIGQMANDYHDLITQASALSPQAQEMLGAACFSPGRISYALNLRGPAFAVDSASSSSMVALHLACRALRHGEVDMAIAGGVSLFLTQRRFHVMERVGILSPTGVCRPFDAAANGTVPGEAIALVVLKRLDRAIADRDAIHGVILGSGLNQAWDIEGITAPGLASQRELMRAVHRQAGLDPATIDYVEAHGTGTPKGDPVEAQALWEAYGGASERTSPCRLGSSKANLGHGFAASGTTSLIKVLMALRHGAIPPQIHHERMNTIIGNDWPFRVNTRLESWDAQAGLPRRAGVCNIGFTGTNGYLVVEEAPPLPEREPLAPGTPLWITLSADNASALAAQAHDLERWLQDAAEAVRLDDLAFTLSVGRAPRSQRLAFQATSLDMVRGGLRAFLDGAAGGIAIHHGRVDQDGQQAQATDFAAAGPAWVKGARVAWASFFDPARPHRLHLPVRAFADQRYWVPVPGDAARSPEAPKAVLRLRDLAAPPVAAEPEAVEPSCATGDQLEQLCQVVGDTLYIEARGIDLDTPFADLGLDSILAIELANAIKTRFGVTLATSVLYDHPTVRRLAATLAQPPAKAPATPPAPTAAISPAPLPPDPLPPDPLPPKRAPAAHKTAPIAIIGLSGRFPGAADVDAFWDNLAAGQCAISQVPADRLAPRGFFDPNQAAGLRAGFLADIDHFDAAFFNMGRAEAEQTDPQHRLLLEEVWKAIEDAGYQAAALAGGRCGVFLGLALSGYHARIRSPDPHSLLGNMGSGLASRLSYLFDWRGPCVVVDNACASSFVALEQACRSLDAGECDAAIIGGVHIASDDQMFRFCQAMGLLSPSGECRPFAADADGWVIGEAVGALVLKRLDDALSDGDHIEAVILGCASHQDGAKNGLTAPKAAGQLQLQREVYRQAGIEPRTIGLLEAHGTSSQLGDEAELSALGASFGERSQDRGFCALGTLKPNIGHALEAAGIACLIKVIQALRHGQLPPMRLSGKANPALEQAASPFYLVAECRDWPRPADHPRRAAINGLSLTGTNCHVIVEEFVAAAADQPARRAPEPGVFALSARGQAQLRALAARLLLFLRAHPAVDWNHLVFTLQTGRKAMSHRLAFVAHSVEEAARLLSGFLDGQVTPGLHQGCAAQPDAALHALLTGDEGRGIIEQLQARQSLEKLAHLWVAGIAIDWSVLHRDTSPRRLRLPTYPFAAERYWLADEAGAAAPVAANTNDNDNANANVLEALLQATIARVLRAKPADVGLDDALAEHGLGSLHALRVMEIVRSSEGLDIPAALFFGSRSIRELARQVAANPDWRHGVPAARQPQHGEDSTPALGTLGLCESQQAIWLIQMLDPDNRDYYIPLAWHWDAPLDLPALTQALSELAAQHPALRTSFPAAATGEPSLRVAATGAVEVIPVDARAWGESERAARLWALARQPLDLAQGPLWRAFALSLPEDGSLLLLVFHHLIFDGQSLGVMLEGIERHDQSARAGQSVAAKPARLGFADFIAQETAYLASAAFEADRAYWLGRFPHGFPALTIPRDGVGGHGSGQLITRSLPGEQLSALQALASAERVTLQAVLLSAFQILLAGAGQQERVVAGIATNLRPAEGFDDVIGCFANILPIAAEIRPAQSFRQTLQLVFADLLAAFAHRRMPFRRLARALAAADATGSGDQLQAAFYFQTWENAAQRRLAARLLPEIHQTGEFDLVFEVMEQAGDWRLNLKYRPSAYSDATARSLAERYLALLARIAADADVEIEPASPFIYPDCCVDALIVQQAERRPDALAALCEDRSLTYGELTRAAEHLARRLREQGVRPGALVAVMVKRSLEMLIALLGVWRAGAAYVPIDLTQPAARIDYMLKDSQVAVVLGHAGLEPRWPGVRTLVVDAESLLQAPAQPAQPQMARSPLELAYVIYTSGSTGAPKGVCITHRNLVHFLCCMAERPGCSAGDHLLALTTISFDIAALELFLPLITGARVEILAEDIARDGLRLKQAVERSGATIIQATPATWKMLLAAELGPVPGLRALCGGEAWDERLAAPLLERVGELWNMYGPTETTIWSSIHKVEPGSRVHLGTPIGNTRFYVVDEAMNQVKPGDLGELLISGDGLARGYLNRPDLDQQRFIANPFAQGERIYRTGDLVRYV